MRAAQPTIRANGDRKWTACSRLGIFGCVFCLSLDSALAKEWRPIGNTPLVVASATVPLGGVFGDRASGQANLLRVETRLE